MPGEADNRKLWIPGKNHAFGTALLTDPVNFYGPKRGLADGLSAFPGSPFAWWDFAGLGLSDGAAVTSVSDLSGNGRTLTNSGVVTYKTNAVGSQGGVNVDSGRVMKWTTATDITQPFTVYIIMAKSSDSGTHTLFSDGTTASRLVTWSTSTVQSNFGTAYNVASVAGTTGHMVIAEEVTGARKLYVDAETALGTSAAAVGSITNDFQIGASSGGGGTTVDQYNCECAIWLRTLTSAEIASLALYTETKYGLSIGA